MKHRRQSLAALRRQAREAADRLEAYAGKIERGYAFPLVDATVNTATTHYDGTLKRHTRLAKRINDPMLLPTWQVIPTSEACLEAAALLRRNPDSIGRCTMPADPITADDTVRDARRLYGDDAATALRRQIDTIDPDDYHAPTVNRWHKALYILVRENEHRRKVSVIGSTVRFKHGGGEAGEVVAVENGKILVRTRFGPREVENYFRPEDLQPTEP